MAANASIFISSCLVCFCLLLHTGLSQIDVTDPSVRYVNIDSCSTQQSPPQFYNPVLLNCDTCSENSTYQKRSGSGLTCECNPGFRYVYDFGGSHVKCQACGANEAVSDDGWECVSCPNTIDAVTGKCGQCSSASGTQEIDVLRELNGQYATPNSVTCQQCSALTQANVDKSRCDRCSVSLSIAPSRASCSCVTGEQQYRGICFTVTTQLSETSLSTITLDSGDTSPSAYLKTNVLADYYLCKDHQDATACQSLANMCVLTMYSGAGSGTATLSTNTICELLLGLTSTGGATGTVLSDLIRVIPQLVITDDADDIIITNEITTEWTVDPETTFPFLLATYSLDGHFEGYRDIDGSFLQLCKNTTESILNAAFVFGTYYSYSCNIPAGSLWNEVTNPLKLYELFLKYNKDGSEWLHRIPIKILNYKDGSTLVNQGDITNWRLVNRFFLVDNQMTKTENDVNGLAPFVRYASDMTLNVELQGSDSKGLIYVPYLEIKYSEVSRDAIASSVPTQFTVDYTMSMSDYQRDFQIAVGTLSSLAVIYAGYRTYVWNKRAGRLTIDFPTLVNFFFYLCHYLGSCFFVIVFGIAFYFFIFFKRQNVVYLVHPEGKAYDEWLALFGAAFALKALALVHMILMQCSADIFLVDWERPKGQQLQKMGDEEVQKKRKVVPEASIWRTYFVANEWNELQTHRKIHRTLQVLAVVFFLHVVEFEDTTTKDPDGTVGKDDGIYRAEQSPMFRMALGALVYILVDIVQVLFFTLVYERFFTDDIREFVDLCSMSNVSVFVMANAEFGYYIHGRSVHGRADVGMREMAAMIDREVNNLVGERGLVPQTEAQTFIMALPKRLRQRYETVYLPVQLENATPASRAEQGRGKEKTIDAYGVLNRFFCAFIDHSLRDVDYVVKEKSFIEKILDTEFLELTDKGIFYNDNGHSFDNVLFYGNELSLVIFDTILFCIIDLIFENFVLAGILTYLIIELICHARQTGGCKNLAKKTLVDERFLI